MSKISISKISAKRAAELVIANKELAFESEEKAKRAAELVIANKELAFESEEKAKRAAELVIANKELAFQAKEKVKRAAELAIANKELAFQAKEKVKRAAELVIGVEKWRAECEICWDAMCEEFALRDKSTLDLRNLNASLYNSTRYDPLTQLANRQLLSDRIQHIQAIGKRSKQKSAILFLDLDHFKSVNDNLGHAFGDLLLQQAAERLKTCVRESDIVARIGGDEFVVLLEELGEGVAIATTIVKKVAQQILALLGQPYQLNQHIWEGSVSVGATLFSGNKSTLDALLKQADVAMYQAKFEGGNALRFFDPLVCCISPNPKIKSK